MNRVDRIVDLIDNALDDMSASGDAMRWTPEPVAAPSSDVDYDQRPLSWSEGIVWDLVHPPMSLDIPPGHFLTVFNEYGVRHHEVNARGEMSSWVRLRPMPPAGSVYVDLSEIDLSAWP